ncbi:MULTISPECIES: alpha/beta hydrolase [Acinetobacter]|uniref:alpha/beta hydrolase n=1 Tax=Acinetobacter TaxID=469 RepID=UPI0015D0D969|nr:MULTISPECIES: alpha/beta hydrolase [Acinetobacter]MCL6232904.1 alpha/beta hydrolase [Acinetobacter amyesii]QOW50278.1 alpha/beta hydrolase [Acinetobacter sp. YH12138]UIJ74866.1 alpha/beta hydrolase [Acinetobacter sp. SH20PTE14]
MNQWSLRLQQKMDLAKSLYRNFRLYDFGSYALNRLTPKQGYHVQNNIPYGLKARHRLDLYRTSAPRQQRPLIVFVHGGAWMHGDKKDYGFIGEAFAKEGFDVAVINYHLAPEYIFPASIDDLSLALNYLTQSQHKLQIEVENVVLMGHSAGAFNVMSALYHPTPYQLQVKENIRAIVGLAGPYHFDYKGDPICADAFDQNVPYQQVMPYYFVEHNQVKHYLFTADKDNIVGHSNSEDFDRRLKASGNHSQLIQIPRVGHITMIGSVSSLFSRFFKTKAEIMRVLDEISPP